jgi:general secretion pathway protein G
MNHLKYLKKRFITLVEMMIVMFLIAMITGVIAYNYSGSLEEGKAFKTKNGITKIHDVLGLYYASRPDEIDNVETEWKNILKKSAMVKNSGELERDGWGIEYQVTKNSNSGDIEITSPRYNTYLQKKGGGSLFKEDKEY